MHVKRLSAIAVGLGVGLGLGLGAARLALAIPDSPYRKLTLFTRVLHYIEENYVEPVKEDAIIYGAVNGMLATLDPHSVFMPPDIYSEMKHDSSGQFGGLGIEITGQDGMIIVVAPIAGTPASKAGIRAGDRILRIDGASTKGMSVLEAARAMRGKPGERVDLEVERSGLDHHLDIKVIRARIRLVPVDSRLLDEKVAYLRIKAFQKDTARSMATHLDRLEHEAGGLLHGLVIDLRNNPGGLLDQAVKVVDELIDTGEVVSTRGRNRRHEETYFAHEGGRTRVPTVVLINGGSASASEIVAGALQDHGRGVIVGTQSFGKGSVQTVVDLPDGSGLKLTIARYYTPNRRSIHGTGITPDILVETSPALEAEAGDADDAQLKSALDHLRALRIFRGEAP